MFFDEIKSLFHKPKKAAAPQKKPSWEETVRQMAKKDVHFSNGTAVHVYLSSDREKRVIIVKSARGFYFWTAEYLAECSDEEWRYMSEEKGALPAMWFSLSNYRNSSLFGTAEEAINDFESSPLCRMYFTEGESGDFDCPLLKRPIDEGTCYDIQMVNAKCIKPEILPFSVDREKCDKICGTCPRNPLP